MVLLAGRGGLPLKLRVEQRLLLLHQRGHLRGHRREVSGVAAVLRRRGVLRGVRTSKRRLELGDFLRVPRGLEQRRVALAPRNVALADHHGRFGRGDGTAPLLLPELALRAYSWYCLPMSLICVPLPQSGGNTVE